MADPSRSSSTGSGVEGIASSLFELDVSIAHSADPSVIGVDWLDQIPTAVAGESALIDYPASMGDSDGIVINTRVPAHWISAIDHIREMPGTSLPTIWPTRGAFFRWCVAIGMAELNKISKVINSDNPEEQLNIDPALRARIFVEKGGGRVTARASVMNEAQASIKEIAVAVKALMAIDEPDEAADLLNEWIAGATAQDSMFWKNFFSKILVNEQDMKEPVAKLIKSGRIIDEYVIQLAESAGILAEGYNFAAPLQVIPAHGTDPDTTGDIRIGSVG